MEPKVTANAKAISGQTFDYIVCGGGTSGCVIAAELASIHNVSVLLVEAGRDSGLAPDVLVPGKYLKQLQEDKEGLWELETIPQPQLNARKLIFLRGKQLGGSSWVPLDPWNIVIKLRLEFRAVNYMALARGPAADYDEWARIVGENSWKWENILPLMREVGVLLRACWCNELTDCDSLRTLTQSYPQILKVLLLRDLQTMELQGKAKSSFCQRSAHSHRRPLKIGFGDEMVPGMETFVKACLENGIPICPDINSGNPVGVGLAQFNVRNGERCYAANAFLSESARSSLKNLTIVTETECDRVHSGDKVATGVDLYHRPTGASSEFLSPPWELITDRGQSMCTAVRRPFSALARLDLLKFSCCPVSDPEILWNHSIFQYKLTCQVCR